MTFSFSPARKSYDHQLRIFNETVEQRERALFMEPGTGKTKVSIDLASEWYLRKEIDTAIVLAPYGVHEQWEDEQLPEHMPLEVPYGAVVFDNGMSERKRREVRKILMPGHKGLRWLMIGYESFITEAGQELVKWLLANYNTAIIADESSRIRNPQSKRTKALLKLAPMAKKRLALSGTPAPRGLEGIWAQMEFLNGNILECPSFTAFKTAYCREQKVDPDDPRKYSPKFIVGYKNEADLERRVSTVRSVAIKRDCLDLPPLVFLPRRNALPSSGELRPLYLKMREEGMNEINESLSATGKPTAVTTKIVLSRRMKLRQLCCGFQRDNDGVDHWISDYRLDEVLEIVRDSNENILLWSSFQMPTERLRQAFIKSRISFIKDDEPEARKRFQAGQAQVWLGSAQRSGIGLNLTRASLQIFYNPIDDWEQHQQAIDRSDRAGQTAERTGVIQLYAPGTIEPKIMNTNKSRKSVNDIVFQANWEECL